MTTDIMLLTLLWLLVRLLSRPIGWLLVVACFLVFGLHHQPDTTTPPDLRLTAQRVCGRALHRTIPLDSVANRDPGTARVMLHAWPQPDLVTVCQVQGTHLTVLDTVPAQRTE